MNLPKQDSATGRGLKTTAQAVISSTLLLVGAIFAAVKGVPGCPEAVGKVLQDNFVLIVSSFGLSTGLISFIWNLLRKNIRTY